MIRYFAHGPHIIAVEDAEQQAKYLRAGWTEITREAFMAAWASRDAAALAERVVSFDKLRTAGAGFVETWIKKAR